MPDLVDDFGAEVAILQQLCTFPPLNAFSEHLQIAAQVEHPRKARPQHHIFEWRARSVEQALGLRLPRHRIAKQADIVVRPVMRSDEGPKRAHLFLPFDLQRSEEHTSELQSLIRISY